MNTPEYWSLIKEGIKPEDAPTTEGEPGEFLYVNKNSRDFIRALAKVKPVKTEGRNRLD